MKRLLILSLSLLALGCKTVKEVEVDRSEYNWQLVWSDEFDGDSIDESKWNFVTGAGGYGNNELQNYTNREENARIKKGKLVIEAHEEDFQGSPYTSAKMTTQNKGDWTYGRFEIRAKLPKGQGIWPAFWMMPTDYSIYGPWPACGEIDIMELIGHEPSKTHGTLHYGYPHKYTGGSYTLEKGDFSSDYHVFALEWLPGEMRWYVDGELFLTQNKWFSNPESIDDKLEYPAPFDRDFYLQLNLAVGGNWPGYPDETTRFPQKIEIDWVRVYEAADGYKRFKRPKEKSSKPVKGRDPQDNGNYVLNDSFDSGLDHWEFGNYEGGSGSATVENGEVHIAIKNAGGQTWANQLLQSEMNVQAGATYELKFKARAEAPRTFMLKVGGLGDRGWAAYSGEQIVELDTEMKEYTFEFSMSEKTDVKARYEFNMGLSDADIWLDDISMVMLEGVVYEEPPRKPLQNGNLIYNGKFDTGIGRTAYWELDLKGDSDAMISVTPDIYQRELNIITLTGSSEIDDIILKQSGFDLEEDYSYTLSFDAKAVNDRSLYAVIAAKDGSVVTELVQFDLNKTLNRYEAEFYIPQALKKASLAFLVGGDSEAKIIKDNVRLVKIKKPYVISGNTRIEAEDFFDKTATPQTQPSSEGTLNVGWMTKGDWLSYRVITTETRTYTVRYRVASAMSSVPFALETSLGKDEHTFPGSGDWQSWETVESTIEIPEGESEIRFSGVDINLEWLEIE